MKKLSREVRSLAIDAGADMVGFAPVERFANGPEKTQPNYYMPKAQSVIVAGIGFPRSIGEVWGTFAEEGALPGPYMWFGFAYLNWELSRVALKVAKMLESHGYRSLPIPPAHTLVQYRYYEHFDRWNRYLGDFSHKHAALAAGLGTFGWSNLFLTPAYGARQRFISVITEAPLEPGELMAGEKLCQPNLCGYACVETCPIGALSKEKFQEFTMDGRIYRYGALDHMRCRWCLDGFTQGSGSRGLDANYDEISETVTLAGSGTATTSETYLRVYRAFVAGSQEPTGDIDIANGGTTYARIQDDEHQTLMALWTVPAGYTAYLLQTDVTAFTEQNNKFAVVWLQTRELNGVFRTKDKFAIVENTHHQQYQVPLPIPEKTDIRIRAIGSSGSSNIELSAGMDIIYIENTAP